MKLPRNYIEQGITEQDVLNMNSNSYEPGFMQIHLTTHFHGSFLKMDSLKAKGSFLHEYIHYLQNITTPWGLYTSMVEYKIMVEYFKYVQSHTDIKLPLSKISLDKATERMSSVISVGNGDNPLKMGYGSCKVDRSFQIKWHRKVCDIEGSEYSYIALEVLCEGEVRTIRLGAYIIKESMAALYQMQLDSTATHEKYDLPYNIVKILAEQSFTNISNDDRKLITICYLSLFSLSPGEVLISQLEYANNNPKLTGMQLLEYFFQNNKIVINKKKSMNIIDFYDDISNRFEKILKQSLLTKNIDYVHETLQRVNLKNGFVPIISLLYEENFGEELVDDMINQIGIPYVYTDYNEYNYPEIDGKKSMEFSVLIGQHALFNFLVHPNRLRCCPLKYQCKDTDMEKDECFDEPWNGKDCPMTVMGGILNLKEKNVMW